ncbi:hypothetical protein RKD23_000385 [Streptomyces sp. SAI-170]
MESEQAVGEESERLGPSSALLRWRGRLEGKQVPRLESCRQDAYMSTEGSGMIESPRCPPLGPADEDSIWHAAIDLFRLNSDNAYDALACLNRTAERRSSDRRQS